MRPAFEADCVAVRYLAGMPLSPSSPAIGLLISLATRGYVKLGPAATLGK